MRCPTEKIHNHRTRYFINNSRYILELIGISNEYPSINCIPENAQKTVIPSTEEWAVVALVCRIRGSLLIVLQTLISWWGNLDFANHTTFFHLLYSEYLCSLAHRSRFLRFWCEMIGAAFSRRLLKWTRFKICCVESTDIRYDNR